VATCPSGHESGSDDFCDVCGVLIGAAPSLGPGLDPDAGPAPVTDSTVSGAAPRWSESCPACGTARDGQFCESCGHNFAAPGAQAPDTKTTIDPWPAVPVPAGPVPAGPVPAGPVPAGPALAGPALAGAAWTAVVSADRAYYDTVQAAGGQDAASIEFPAYCPQRRFPLDRAEVRIGRHSASSGISPEIDLSVAPADPGISRLHAVLLRAADGSWAIVDPGSANGTLLNGAELAPGQVVPVRDGDRIHLGAWTELRLTRGG
jgi:FHA domain